MAFRRVFRSLNRLRGRDTHLGGSELSHAQFELLIELDERGELPAGELALAARLAPGTVTQMLDHLAESGHVERARSETDRRVVVSRLTLRGGARSRPSAGLAEPLGAGARGRQSRRTAGRHTGARAPRRRCSRTRPRRRTASALEKGGRQRPERPWSRAAAKRPDSSAIVGPALADGAVVRACLTQGQDKDGDLEQITTRTGPIDQQRAWARGAHFFAFETARSSFQPASVPASRAHTSIPHLSHAT